MRLWSLHPRYLDAKGLVAAWREALLAQAVLSGDTRGYKNHPQLARFKRAPAPNRYIASYLQALHEEACRRGYRFDERKITHAAEPLPLLSVTEGQLLHEWAHLESKLAKRAPEWLAQLENPAIPQPHPLFTVVPGEVEEWEKTVRS